MGKRLPRAESARLELERAMGTFRRTDTAADLDRAIKASRQALAAIPADDAGRVAILSDLGILLRTRFMRGRSAADAAEAVDVGEQAQAACPANDPNLPLILSSLGASLAARYLVSGRRSDLDRAVETGEQALAASPQDGSGHFAVLANLGGTLGLKHALTSGTQAGLDQTIELAEAALAGMSADHPDRPLVLSNLGIALRTRYDRTRRHPDLERAIEVGEEAVDRSPPDHPDRATFLNGLGLALEERFLRDRTAADADRAVELEEQAANAAASPAARATCLANLSIARRTRFTVTQTQADLDGAVDAAADAVAELPSGHPDRALPLAALALARQVRYRRTGTEADLDQAIEAGEEAVTVLPAESVNYAAMLSDLGLARRARAERTGSPDDLARAIEVSEQAVEAFPRDHAKRAGCLANLGSALRVRYERVGALRDLERAIEVTRQALAAVEDDDPDRAGMLSNLGVCMGSRFERTGVLADLDHAIEIGEWALAATPPDAPEYARRLSNLAADLMSRFERAGAPADLDRAVEAGELAVAGTRPGQAERANYLSNLCVARRLRFARTGTPGDLDRAIQAGEQAVASASPEDPDQAGWLSNLGSALLSRFSRTGSVTDLDRVIAAGRDGAAVVTAPPGDRVRAARLSASVAAGAERWDVAAESYALAVELLPQVASRSIDRPDQEYWLSELGGLAAQATACCLEADRVHMAVELWEQGRGVLLGQALDIRPDLGRLAGEHPQLAEAFSQVRDELARLPSTTRVLAAGFALPTEPDAGDAGLQVGERRRQLSARLDRVTAEIRSRPGFERFLRPLPVSELLPPAGEYVILVNVSDIRSDALVLTSSGVRPVSLPQLDPRAVVRHATELRSALQDAHDRTASEADCEDAEQRISRVLGWLWDAIAGPVLDELDITGKPAQEANRPRLWWCPSGLLSLLPLHAAGHHQSRFDEAPRTVLDRAVSSYTPTVRSLIHSRRPTSADRGRARAERLLAVAMPRTPDANDLPGAGDETTMLRQLFGARATVLTGPQATRESVTAALPDCSWAHFACHAASNLAQPSASQLLLSDYQRHPLTVLELNRLLLDEADLAFLSACATASSGTRLPDEAIHLSAAFQLAGYRHVIATLWSISDYSGVRLADIVYPELDSAGPRRAALALHHAVCRRRNLLARKPSTWAAFIHTGA